MVHIIHENSLLYGRSLVGHEFVSYLLYQQQLSHTHLHITNLTSKQLSLKISSETLNSHPSKSVHRKHSSTHLNFLIGPVQPLVAGTNRQKPVWMLLGVTLKQLYGSDKTELVQRNAPFLHPNSRFGQQFDRFDCF